MQQRPSHVGDGDLKSTISSGPTLSKIIVGLGNPGLRYRQTRHNLGFEILDRCADLLQLNFVKDRSARAMIAKRSQVGGDLTLIKPLTFMNLSGHSLTLLRKQILFASHQILAICDDIALPLGTFRLRASGGSGGHNGLKSLNRALGSTDFARLRVGVGQPPDGVGLDTFVLAPFGDHEKETVASAVVDAAACALKWVWGVQNEMTLS